MLTVRGDVLGTDPKGVDLSAEIRRLSNFGGTTSRSQLQVRKLEANLSFRPSAHRPFGPARPVRRANGVRRLRSDALGVIRTER